MHPKVGHATCLQSRSGNKTVPKMVPGTLKLERDLLARVNGKVPGTLLLGTLLLQRKRDENCLRLII